MPSERTFSSESVTEGHPDKLADRISDTVLDEALAADPRARVACETMVKVDQVWVAGEITTTAELDVESLARRAICEAGYDDEVMGYDGNLARVRTSIVPQSPDVEIGINRSYEVRRGENAEALDGQGAGDQGMMFGFACRETPDLMPLPIWLAHRIAKRLASARKTGAIPYLRPDGKTQVSICYAGQTPTRLETVVISTQHHDSVNLERRIEADLREHVVAPVLEPLDIDSDGYRFVVNPTGRFVLGGPHADAGLTGRKVIVDTYGGSARHGGGAFSGKDPSKTDRCGAYAARWVAKNVVACGAADTCEVQVAYAIGVERPISTLVEAFGTERVDPSAIVAAVDEVFDLRPSAIIRDLDLARPIYTATSAYGHFGRSDIEAPWERTDKVAQLAAILDLS